jgi:hypothetical protein
VVDPWWERDQVEREIAAVELVAPKY